MSHATFRSMRHRWLPSLGILSALPFGLLCLSSLTAFGKTQTVHFGTCQTAEGPVGLIYDKDPQGGMVGFKGLGAKTLNFARTLSSPVDYNYTISYGSTPSGSPTYVGLHHISLSFGSSEYGTLTYEDKDPKGTGLFTFKVVLQLQEQGSPQEWSCTFSHGEAMAALTQASQVRQPAKPYPFQIATCKGNTEGEGTDLVLSWRDLGKGTYGLDLAGYSDGHFVTKTYQNLNPPRHMVDIVVGGEPNQPSYERDRIFAITLSPEAHLHIHVVGEGASPKGWLSIYEPSLGLESRQLTCNFTRIEETLERAANAATR